MRGSKPACSWCLAALVGSALSAAWAAQPAELPASQPAATMSAADPQRVEDLVTLIEGANLPLNVRRTGARELLRLNWPQAPERLSGILGGSNEAAKTAVALALGDVPEQLHEAYIQPLIEMLADPDAEIRQAAAAALAGYRDGGVIDRLRTIMLDDTEALPRRLAVIEALGTMSKRPAVAALMEAVERGDSPLLVPALESLERITALSFGGEAARALSWWQRTRDEPLPEWQQDQIERLVQKSRDLGRRARGLEERLVEAYRLDYTRTPETERGAVLQRYLRDEAALVRLLGLELVQRQLGEGKPLPADTGGPLRDIVRELLTDADPAVRAAAVQAVARFREPADAGRFERLLSAERHLGVRRALVNALGYVGGNDAVPVLLSLSADADEPAVAEAIGALGRLAERGALGGASQQPVSDALLQVFQRTTSNDAALRERTLWAMSQVKDPRFGDVFAAALAESEATTVRQAAIRGLAALGAQRLEPLVPLTRDTDVPVRRTAVEVLSEAGANDEHLAALWERMPPTQEPDATIRQIAWQGAVRLLSRRSIAEIEQWLGRLPESLGDRDERIRELLDVVEVASAKVPEALGELGRLWARLAVQRDTQGRTAPAIFAYMAALRNLRAAQASETTDVALALLRCALFQGRYDETVAAVLANGTPPLDGAAVWSSLQRDLEQRCTREQATTLVPMLDSLLQHPPTTLAPATQKDIRDLLERARALRGSAPESTATQPESANR